MSYQADQQVIDAHTDRHTDRQTQATKIPEGQTWPRVKNDSRYTVIVELYNSAEYSFQFSVAVLITLVSSRDNVAILQP